MAKKLLFEVVTPDRLVLRQEVESVTAPGTAGDFTVLALHIPFMSSLRIGALSCRAEGVVQEVFVSGGFVEVGPTRVLVLAEVAERSEEIDADRARRARERAAERLAVEQRERFDYARAKAALQRAVMRLKLHQDAVLSQSGHLPPVR